MATAAGLATLRLLDDAVYAAARRDRGDGRAAGVARRSPRRASRTGVAGRREPVQRLLRRPTTCATTTRRASRRPSATRPSSTRCSRRGVYLPPSAFEAWFVSAAHDDAALDRIADALPAPRRGRRRPRAEERVPEREPDDAPAGAPACATARCTTPTGPLRPAARLPPLRPRAGRWPRRWPSRSPATTSPYVVASPLERAQETAAPIAAALGLPSRTDDRLIEAGNHFEGIDVRRRRRVAAPPAALAATCSTRSGRRGASRTARSPRRMLAARRRRARRGAAATRRCWSATSCRSG